MNTTEASPRERATQILNHLNAAGGRRTPIRVAILELLAAADPDHLTTTEVHDQLTTAGWPTERSAVHRTLTDFTDRGYLHLVHATGPAAYGLAEPPHHHAICDHCHKITALPGDTLHNAVRSLLATVEASITFQPSATSLTLPGRCAHCR